MRVSSTLAFFLNRRNIGFALRSRRGKRVSISAALGLSSLPTVHDGACQSTRHGRHQMPKPKQRLSKPGQRSPGGSPTEPAASSIYAARAHLTTEKGMKGPCCACSGRDGRVHSGFCRRLKGIKFGPLYRGDLPRYRFSIWCSYTKPAALARHGIAQSAASPHPIARGPFGLHQVSSWEPHLDKILDVPRPRV
jgi:hypothetical protein